MITSIYAHSDSGKSTSIRFMVKLLLDNQNYSLCGSYYQEEFQEVSKEELRKTNKDVIAVFEDKKNDKIILISSGGDTEWIIASNLKKLEDEVRKIRDNWDDIKKDSSKYLLITGVKYGRETGAAYKRSEIVNGFAAEGATWILPPFVWGAEELTYSECPEYEYVYRSFACAILAKYDNYYKNIINQIK